MDKYKTPIAVRFSDLDPYGHVNHAVYLTYFELARTEKLAANGLSLMGLKDLGLQLVVAKVEVKYKRPVTQDQTVFVETTAAIKRASVVWEQSLITDGALAAEATIKNVVTDQAGHPVRPPQLITDIFDA